MGELTIHKDCQHCNGQGKLPGGSSDPMEPIGPTCGICSGTGKIGLHYLDYGDNILHAYEILECLDATEHNALTDTQKDGVLAILACGLVDLNDGKAGRVRLWNWFGAGSTTVANLTALLA